MTDGTIGLIREVRDGGVTMLAQSSIAPFTPGSTHRLMITCTPPGPLGGGTVVGFINGEPVVHGVDHGPSFTILAAGLKAAGAPRIDVRFDNAVGALTTRDLP